MTKYRKKPVTVEEPDTIDPRLDKMYMDSFLKAGLPALEAERGKPDIFEQTYERIE